MFSINASTCIEIATVRIGVPTNFFATNRSVCGGKTANNVAVWLSECPASLLTAAPVGREAAGKRNSALEAATAARPEILQKCTPALNMRGKISSFIFTVKWVVLAEFFVHCANAANTCGLCRIETHLRFRVKKACDEPHGQWRCHDTGVAETNKRLEALEWHSSEELASRCEGPLLYSD